MLAKECEGPQKFSWTNVFQHRIPTRSDSSSSYTDVLACVLHVVAEHARYSLALLANAISGHQGTTKPLPWKGLRPVRPVLIFYTYSHIFYVTLVKCLGTVH